MSRGRLFLPAAFAFAAAVAATTACERTKTVTETVFRDTGSTVTVTVHDTVRFNEFRVFNQIERLGNPLVSEALLEKRDHGFHNTGSPATDRANFKAKIVKFITTVAGRSPGTASAIADVLLPDMIVVQTDKAANTAGYLGYVFNPNAYGGRRLQDDVVDISLGAVFGTLVDPSGASPGLATDNVPAFGGGAAPGTTFPYLAAPNAP
ncbi:MAG TPA: DUF4331 family protein [Gemmatimonadaceae bacterium]|nr:DUF4331 family protein [Gemmatimonadaceae bacterium]